MTIYTPNSSGNWSTAATWDTVANAPTIGSAVSVTTAGINSDTWTAPNTTNAVTGAWLCMTTRPAAGRDWDLELFQSGVATGTIATMLQTDMPTPDTVAPDIWVYFRFATPFTYTTTAANAYRFQLRSTTANSGAVRNNAGATGFAALATDNRNAVPAGAHQAFVGPHNANTSIIVTVDGTTGAVTGGVATSQEPTLRTYSSHAILVGGSATPGLAKIVFDSAADSTVTFLGNVVPQAGGVIEFGTASSPLPAGVVAALRSNAASTSAITPFQSGYITGHSARVLTYTRTTYSSGLGTAASPLIMADPVDWNVGDKICVAAVTNNATNYNEAENRWIITKNSATSYVVSATKGGAESALANTHTAGLIVNLTRGVVIENTGGGTAAIVLNLSRKTNSNCSFSWANLNNMGTHSGAPAIVGSTQSQYGLLTSAAYPDAINNCVFDNINAYGMINQTSIATTYAGLVFANSVINSSLGSCAGLGVMSTAVNQSFPDLICINLQRQGVEYRGVNCTFDNPEFNTCNKAGIANQGYFQPVNAAPFTMNNAEAHCNRGGLALNGGANAVINGGNFGTRGYNTVDVAVADNTANTNMLFDGSTFGSTNFVTGHTSGAVGATELLFNRLNNTDNNHMFFNENGSARSTGAGLVDATVRTPGTLNLRLTPENATNGFQWEYLVPAVPGKAVQSFLFIEKNATFGTDDALIELFLPGSTVADATANVNDVTGTYQVYSVAADYAGSINLYARIRITAKSVAAGAYLYIADITNGTNDIINLKTWHRAKPSSIMFEQLGDAGAVWAYLLDGTYNAGDMMKIISAVLAGKVSNAGTANETFRNLMDTLDRLINTVDASGNRTALTYDLS